MSCSRRLSNLERVHISEYNAECAEEEWDAFVRGEAYEYKLPKVSKDGYLLDIIYRIDIALAIAGSDPNRHKGKQIYLDRDDYVQYLNSPIYKGEERDNLYRSGVPIQQTSEWNSPSVLIAGIGNVEATYAI